MTRTDKFPETCTFHYNNVNPHNRMGGDCVVRAIALALGQSWETTIKELTEISLKTGYVLNDRKCYEKYLANKGWVKHNQPKKIDGTKYTGVEFCANQTKWGRNYIARIGGHHMTAIVDCRMNDIWDCTGGCVGNYWTKGE